ncbi:alpha/beta hydrolase [Streptomyces hainanensis]|uniref:alpha/beta hydrolase n=1 Tax=Streptomyces hainanensis TaxID=402648 RepID=UPI0014047AAD|nr:alpha/beta hydrolase [Streptomyces hainanensis]
MTAGHVDGGTHTELVDQRHEPLLVTSPRDSQYSPQGQGRWWVLFVHAPGENRTGNNYWQATTARVAAGYGLVAVRFDLSGYGESLGEKDLDVWDEQLDDALATAERHGALGVHVVARGLHSALLARVAPSGRRIALYPPPPRELTWWIARRTAAGPWPSNVTATHRPAGEERTFWEWCGAEANLVGGLTVPARTLDPLVEGVLDAARTPECWDVSVVPAGADQPCRSRLVCGRDHLLRLESDRTGIAHLLSRHLIRPEGTGGQA